MISETAKQRRLNGRQIEYPDCEFEGCSAESTRVFELRGMSVDQIYCCDRDDHEPYWKGPGGIENIRSVDPARDAKASHAEGGKE